MQELAPIVEEIRAGSATRRPSIVGIGGPVAVGKTTIAEALGRELDAQLLSTDSFLLPNSTLAERHLSMRKGFPETYDLEEVARVMRAVRRGESVDVREYSHRIYDVVAGSSFALGPADVVVVEGVVALQAPMRDHLNIAVYVDAAGSDVRRWFIERFHRFVRDASGDEGSFYHGFTALEEAQITAIAEATWDGINGPNLTEHIGPSREEATFIVRKGADHRIIEVTRVSDG
jgi:type I pantothenate kinase